MYVLLLYLFLCPLRMQLHRSRSLCLFHSLLRRSAGSMLDAVFVTAEKELKLTASSREGSSLIHRGLGPEKTLALGRCLAMSGYQVDAFLGWFIPRRWEAYQACCSLNRCSFELFPVRLASLLRKLYGEGGWQAASPRGSRLHFRSISFFAL